MILYTLTEEDRNLIRCPVNPKELPMTRTHARGASNLSRGLLSILTLAAVGGWGMFVYSTQVSSDLEKQLHGQISTLRNEQAKFLSEQKARASTEAALTQLREQLSSTRNELRRLAENHNRVQSELAETRTRLEAAQKIQDQRNSEIPKVLIDVIPRPARRDIVAAQKALTELGYGKLEADGVVGAGTRQAIEEYQRDAGLAVTGDLRAETLQKLLAPSGRLTAQSED
jgi:TolA-binding protein